MSIEFEIGGQRFVLRNPAQPVPSDVTYLSLAEDASGRVLASFSSSVGRFAGGAWEIVSEQNGFGKGTVSSIMQDREGDVWFGLLGPSMRIRISRFWRFTLVNSARFDQL